MDRLEGIVRTMRVIADVTGQAGASSSMHRVHDHKGELTVVWRAQGLHLRRHVEAAWRSYDECNIKHLMMDEYQRELAAGRLAEPSIPRASASYNGFRWVA
jgi:hypothetical protein